MARSSSESSGDAGGVDAETEAATAALVSEAEIGVFRLAPTGEVARANEGLAALVERSPDDLAGRPLADLLATVPPSVTRFVERARRAPDESDALTVATALATASDGTVACDLHLRALRADAASGVVGVVHRTGRRPNARERTRPSAADAPARAFVALADAVRDGIVVLDTESQIQYANPAIERILGHDPADLVGGSKLEIIPEHLRDAHLDALRRYLDTGDRNLDWEYVELPGRHADGHEVPLAVSLNDFVFDGDRYFVGLFRDISRRKEAERALAAQVAQQEVVSELGYTALETADVDGFLAEVAERVAGVLDAEFCGVFEVGDDATATLRAGVGWEDGRVGTATVPTDAVKAGTSASASQVDGTLAAGEPVVVEGFADPDADDPDGVGSGLLHDHGVRSGVSAVVGPPDDPWGMIGAFDAAPREVESWDVHFVESVATVVATAVSRHEYVRQLEAQRTQLDALNRLNRLIQETQRAVVRLSSREEIERLVCDRIVERDPYELAWVGRVDLRDETVTPVARAGDADGCPAVTDGDAGGERIPLGPAEAAIRTGEPHVVPFVPTDEAFASWRDTAFDCDHRSMVAVPVVHEGTVFGVLFVYADDVAAFGADVRSVLESFGETLGHAVAAANREHALASRDVTEAQLRLDGYVDRLMPDAANADALTVTRVIPVGDASYVAYGEAPADAAAGLRSLVAETSRFSELSIEETDDGIAFEIRVAESALFARIAGYGGRIAEVVFDDGDLIATVELPPDVELTSVTDAIRSISPEMSLLLTHRRTASASADPDTLLADLTDRQHTALEAAYFGGFFEWPRESNAEEVAETLGISSPTFQEHLRAGLRKTVAQALDDRRSSVSD